MEEVGEVIRLEPSGQYERFGVCAFGLDGEVWALARYAEHAVEQMVQELASFRVAKSELVR